MKNRYRVLVTGAAGFIGFHVAHALLQQSVEVIGLDNLCDYYNVDLKRDRLAVLGEFASFTFLEQDIVDGEALNSVFSTYEPSVVIHLAAQAGVRYSIENPTAFGETNLMGFLNVLEACRANPVAHFLYASSSSVYGGNVKVPFSVEDAVDHPVSLYAATKKSNELMAHAYSHLYGIPTTGLRFFTVYGPWGRPDMAYYSFTKNILDGNPISVFNHGKMERDFTYVDDVVEGIMRLIPLPPVENSASEGQVPYKIYNIGNHHPISLEHFIHVLEETVGKEAEKNYMPMQPGDVLRTCADVSDLEKRIGFKPQISLEEGMKKFVDWYKSYYQ
jgi:UDP-glucuronate 4-epimerase